MTVGSLVVKCIERYFTVAVVVLALLSGCTSSSEGADLGPNEAATATAVADAGTTPDPSDVEVEPEFTDQERIDVALAALDAAVANGDGPEGTIAYDLLGSEFEADSSIVTFTICAWTGTSISETVRDSLWRTTVQEDGTLAATHVTTPVAAGDCQNTQLIESALATASAYDEFWNDVAADPALFATDDRQQMIGEFYLGIYGAAVEGLVEDELRVVGARAAGPLLESLVADILWRREFSEDVSTLEFVFCRDMDPERGIYRGDVLVDDGRADEDPGLHSIDAFQLTPEPAQELGWLVVGRNDLIWSDCIDLDWPSAATNWRGLDRVPFEVLDQ